ncbi:MAG: acyl-CoA dehydrogenase family protein [Candidatus Sulfomarinibacteraceae bacterium]
MRDFSDYDLYQVDSLLTDDERMVRDSVREWVGERVMPSIEDWAWECRFPTELIPEMAELDLLGAPYSAYDLPGLGAVAYGLINQELERADSGLRSFVSVQTSLVMFPILEWGSDAQKDRWIPALGSGRAIGCFGLTEPDFGSNPGGMRTRAVRDGDEWVLNGEKAWITNGGIADVAVVWARTDEGVRGFLVERGTEGFETYEHKGKYSLRVSVTSQLAFSDCRIPADNILPGTTGLKNALMCLNQARYGIAWGALGSAMATFSAALNYSTTRVQFSGRPIAAHQITQVKLAEMYTQIDKGQLVALQLGRMKEAGTLRHEAVSLAKRNNVAVAPECAKTAREIHGANGIVNEYPIMRHLMNIETVFTYEGTHDIHTLVLGNYLTGIPAFE